MSAFFPDTIKDNTTVPPVVFTDFQLDNEPVPIGTESVLQRALLETRDLTLAYDDRVITFEFAALNYISPEKNRYRYKLEGFDNDWIEVGSDRRRVTYTNLDPGEYTLRVMGSNNDGIWNGQATSLRLVITPPWWETTWFRVALGFLAFGLIAGGFVWQRRHVVVQQRKLESLVAERTASLAYTKDQLSTLFNTSPLGISLTTGEGQFLAVNPALQQLTGYTEEECYLQARCDKTVSRTRRAHHNRQSASAKQPVHDFRVVLQRKDGSPFTANISAGRLTGSDSTFSSPWLRMKPKYWRQRRRCTSRRNAGQKKKRWKTSGTAWRGTP